MNTDLQVGVVARRVRNGIAASTLAVLFALLVIGFIGGVAVAVLPLSLSITVSLLLVGCVALVIAALGPELRAIPQKSLGWGFVIVLMLYFVWPRNVFLPVSVLPVKHPQRLTYLLFLAYAFYVLVKCVPARTQVIRGLRALPWLTGLWIALAVWQLVSLMAAKHSLALTGNWFLELLVVTIVYPLVLLCCPDLGALRRLLWGLLLAAALNVAFALPETLMQRNLFDRFVSLEYIDPVTAHQIVAAKVRGGQFRAQAAFDHPLLFAEFLAVCLPFAAAFVLSQGRGRLLALTMIGALLLGLYLTHSRVAVVAALLVGVAMITALIVRGAQTKLRRNPWPLVASLLALPVVIGGVVIATDTVQQLTLGRTADEASSTSVRLEMLRAGGRLILQEPLFGYGPGMAGVTLNFQNTFGVMTLDNYLLAHALDAGLPGLTLFVLVLLGVAGRALLLAIRATIPAVAYLALGVFGAVSAFGPIKVVLGTELNNVLLPVLVGALAILVTQSREGIRQERSTSGLR